MKVKFLDINSQYRSIKLEIDGAMKKVLNNSSFIGGEILSNFERNFADYQDSKFCIGVGNGTDALEIAIESLSFPKGSEIIVPANSFIASSEAISRSGHKVVFSDIDPQTYTISIDDIRRKITKNTKAIIAVHLYGHPCDMDNLIELASIHNLKIIEDCAQAHGASYRGRKVGSIGDIGAFSFYPGKNLGAYGDGGAILTNNSELMKKCRMIANHGRVEKYNHIIEGRNSRLDTLQASILDVKLKFLDGWIEKRRSISQRYISGLSAIDDIKLPFISKDVKHAFHLFVIRTTLRNELQDFLFENGIETGIHYPIALTKLKAYSHLGMQNASLYANKFDEEVLSLPIGEHLNNDSIDYVINQIKKFYNKS